MIAGLTNHLWQSTLFALAAALLTIAFRTNHAPLRYWLWFSASLKFFLPFALLMSFGSQLIWAPAAKKIATPVVSLAIDQISRPFPADPSFVPAGRAPIPWLRVAIFSIWTIGFAVITPSRYDFATGCRFTACRSAAHSVSHCPGSGCGGGALIARLAGTRRSRLVATDSSAAGQELWNGSRPVNWKRCSPTKNCATYAAATT